MKIILRDILQTYFPKHSTIYQSMPLNQRQNILFPTKSKKTQKTQSPPELSAKKSLTLKQKNLLNLQRGRSKQDQNKLKSTQAQQLANATLQQQPFARQENERLSQIMNQRLKQQIREEIKSHRFYNPSISIQLCLNHLSCILLHVTTSEYPPNSSKNSSAPKPIPIPCLQQNLYKLSLYLNKETNKQIFLVYEYILSASPKSGISYETLSKKLKTDIINVSHYCCKLKKMRFIDWQHKKQGIVVFPKLNDHDSRKSKSLHHKDSTLSTVNLHNQQQTFDYSQSFFYNELTLNQNILINVASSSSLLQGGLTNQQIKFKIMKHAENKMVRRTVQGMKYIQRNAERQGKVFEFRYKKETPRMVREMDRKRVESSGIIQLTQNCRAYLNTHFSHFSTIQNLTDQQLLQHIVNTKLTDYVSSIGIKQSKRQCTPLKLNRYIYILNYLEIQGPESQLELRRHIIEVEKDLENYQGIIHKRSVLGILEGLKKIQLIKEIEEYFYPVWVEVQRRPKKNEENAQNLDGNLLLGQFKNGTKKIKTDKKSKDSKRSQQNKQLSSLKNKIRMITKRQHLSEIFAQLLNFTFEKALKRVLRKSFHRIMYVQRKKQSIPMFLPQKNIFHLLDNQYPTHSKDISQHATTLESFMCQITNLVSQEGKQLQNFPQIEHELVKFVRRNPNKNADNLRSKYGRNWKEKFQPLEKQGIIKITDQGYETLERFEGYLV